MGGKWSKTRPKIHAKIKLIFNAFWDRFSMILGVRMEPKSKETRSQIWHGNEKARSMISLAIRKEIHDF